MVEIEVESYLGLLSVLTSGMEKIQYKAAKRSW